MLKCKEAIEKKEIIFNDFRCIFGITRKKNQQRQRTTAGERESNSDSNNPLKWYTFDFNFQFARRIYWWLVNCTSRHKLNIIPRPLTFDASLSDIKFLLVERVKQQQQQKARCKKSIWSLFQFSTRRANDDIIEKISCHKKVYLRR